MAHQKLTRAWIEVAVEQAIRNIKDDPERAIRKLVDLGLDASQGAFQKSILQVAQTMLADERSAYYPLMQRVVTQINPGQIQTFGLNVGLNGCQVGAEKIRQQEAALGCNIPWAFRMDMGETPSADWPTLLNRLVCQSQALGSYVYFLVGEAALSPQVMEVVKAYPDCAFALLVPGEAITPALAERWAQIHHAMLSIGSVDTLAQGAAATILRNCKALYATHTLLSPSHWQQQVSEAALAQIEEWAGVFHFLLPAPGMDAATLEALRLRTVEIRKGQRYAYVIMNLDSDLWEIDKGISGDGCAVTLYGQSRLYAQQKQWVGPEVDLMAQPLEAILQRVAPKKQPTA